jgi:hypothetical protein
VSNNESRRKLQDPSVVSQLARLLRTGTPRAEALRQVGISDSTFYRELRRSPELRNFLEDVAPAASAPPAAPSAQSAPASATRRRGVAEPARAPVEPTAVAPRHRPKATDPKPQAERAVKAVAKTGPAAAAKTAGKTADKPATRIAAKAEGSRKPRRADATAAAKSLTGRQPLGAAAARTAARTKTKPARPGTTSVPGRPNRAARPAVLPRISRAVAPVAPPAGSILPSVPAAHIEIAELIAEAEPSAGDRHGRGIALSAADWLPPATVLMIQLVIGIAVGAHPVVLLLLVAVVGGIVVALRLMRHDVPAEAGPTPEPGSTDADGGSIEAPAGVPQRKPMDLTWVAATIKLSGTAPDDPNQAQKRS